MIPVATPMAKLIPKSFCQYLADFFQNSSPLRKYFVSASDMMIPSPSVRGTKSQWYMAVRANCALDHDTSDSRSIVYSI